MSILIITAQLWFSDVATEHHQQVVSVMPSFPYTDGNQLDHHEVNSESKRLRLMSEQANAAFNSPTTYQKDSEISEMNMVKFSDIRHDCLHKDFEKQLESTIQKDTISTSSLRVLLSLCVQLGYDIYQYDVDTAFPNEY